MATNQPGALDAATDLWETTNRAVTTLAADVVDAVGLTVVVADGSVYPASGRFKITIEDEIFDIASRAGNTLTVETRGAEGTTGIAHSFGTPVAMLFTAGHFEDLRDGIIATQEGYMRRPTVNDDAPQGKTAFGTPVVEPDQDRNSPINQDASAQAVSAFGGPEPIQDRRTPVNQDASAQSVTLFGTPVPVEGRRPGPNDSRPQALTPVGRDKYEHVRRFAL